MRRQARIVIVGHVDHGKSTLIGRLLNDTQSLPDGKVEAVREMSRRRGMPFEWSFVMDALQAERDQGITIDTTQIHFRTKQRPYVIIDAPGHTEFLKNMVTGASSADAALLVIDAGEGALEQSRRHAYLLHLLGVKQVAVIVNKMDMVEFSQNRFDDVSAEIRAYLNEIGVAPGVIVPISARHGDNVVAPSENLPWFKGPTLVEALDAFKPVASEDELPLRMPIQDVYKPDERRILAGRIETGRLRVGDTLHFSPINRTAKIVSIEAWNRETAITAKAGQSIGITLDQRIFVERGHIASLVNQRPIESHRLTVRLFWLASNPLTAGKSYTLKLATAEHRVSVEKIVEVLNIDDLTAGAADKVSRNEIADVVLHSRSLVAVDLAIDLPRTGRGVLLDGNDVVGGFVVTQADPVDARNLQRVEHAVTPTERSRANGHHGAVLWLTGLSGAGKSTHRHGAGAHAVRARPSGLCAGWRRCPPGPQRRPGLLPRRPGGEYPPRRGNRPPVRRSRHDRGHGPDLARPARTAPVPAKSAAAISARSMSRPISTPANPAIPRASTAAPASARSRSSPASPPPTRLRKRLNW